ncbi:UDP-3-O-(3-hydroxymyristoyl)glucosamine N-acyltransferase [Ahniella affigens]|uniref:UDP-3-O-acylglucosamine N-acyltransferase n=1 Tax=Ahniella affigens TaxID=2021234 RepID=A0A2P1PMI0_9GAMM|nr:UDP-3-O-(3-hydroxymyristoyl)glucosamine N-acyltransferase [Ahniella affigens]AVP96054.1 UDP-3-O-(3-hydroxymyristoyl)glucosamine N-acyltransferase [Ahniella affigens]
MSAAVTVAALCERFGFASNADAGLAISGVQTLARASVTDLSFLANPQYRQAAKASSAGLIIATEADASWLDRPCLISRNPYAGFARVAALFEPRADVLPGIHPSAVIDTRASVDPSASIGPLVTIGARSVIAAGAQIGPGCVIGEDCVVGADTTLVARVTLVKRVRLGARVLIHPGAVLGADGFGLAFDQGAWLKVPQLGGVLIGDDCEIGANTTIDRGALDDTILEADVRLDNQIQIGHNVQIGAHTAIAGCTAIAGSAKIGRYCLIAGGAGVVGHIEICDKVTVAAMSLVTHSIKTPGEYASGTPLQLKQDWRKNAVRFKELDTLARRIRKLPGD